MSHSLATAEVPPSASIVLLANASVGLFAVSSIRQSLAKPKDGCQEDCVGIPKINSDTLGGMGWKERLKIAREAVGISKSAFSRLVGVSAPTVSEWESGAIKSIDGHNLVKAAEILEVTPEWLMTGKGGGREACAVEVEFAWVYRHANEQGREFLRIAIGGTRAGYMEDTPARVALKLIKDDEKKA